ncbi:MAG: hypothetical protein L0312_28390, partial [Acidobacteria bacterium]|nr:hypothetical protein [Acidobacteriota bacterium]
SERGMDMEAQVLEIIRDMQESPMGGGRLSVKDITSWFIDRHGEDYEKKITGKWIGYVIRKKLGLKTERGRDGYIVPSTEAAKLARLYEKYGISTQIEDRNSRLPLSSEEV